MDRLFFALRCEFYDVSREHDDMWVSNRELAQMRKGLVKGMEPLDVLATVQGQAEQKMRRWSRKPRMWELSQEGR